MQNLRCEYKEIHNDSGTNVIASAITLPTAAVVLYHSDRATKSSEISLALKNGFIAMEFVAAGMAVFGFVTLIKKLKQFWQKRKILAHMKSGATEHLLVHTGVLTPERFRIPERIIKIPERIINLSL